MTNHFNDMGNSDLIIVCGANPAENHPACIRHVNASRDAGGKMIVIDPRYTRTAAIADAYYAMRAGTDITFFGGLINYIVSNDLANMDYVKSYTNASYLVSENFSFTDGMFNGWTTKDGKSSYDKTQWTYQIESKTPWDTATTYAWTQAPGVPKFTLPQAPVVKKDPTLQDPRCVYQLMKKHYERYTPDIVESVCGIPKDQFKELCEMISATGTDDKSAVWFYAMGQTQHTVGSQNIRAMCIVQELLGNIGIPGGGIAALRGESNVQGSTDFALLFDSASGYMAAPSAAKHKTLADWLTAETTHSGYWANKPKFFVSLLKEYWGASATVDNDYRYDYFPKMDAKNYSFMSIFDNLAKNEGIKGMFLWGMNPGVGGANANMVRNSLKNLDWMVVVDLFDHDTANFWKLPLTEGAGAAKSADIKTEVFQLPAAGHLEKEGTVSNSGRWIQWRYQFVKPPGQAKPDGEIMTMLLEKLQELYKADAGPYPGPILDLNWPYVDAHGEFDPKLVAQAINGYTIKDGKLLPGFAGLQADGSTACGCWVYGGYYNNNDAKEDPAKQPCGARDASDKPLAGFEKGLLQYSQWGFSWPANRRVLYNRASTFKDTGKARNPKRALIEWTGTSWNRNDVPDFAFQTAQVDADKKPIMIPDPKNAGKMIQAQTPNPPEKCPSFFMNGELVSRIWAPGLNDGPFPEHYEPYESPTKNKLSGTQNNPAALQFKDTVKYGSPDKYPIVCTTFRIVEHWQTGVMTRYSPWLTQAMPFMYAEVSEELAKEKGIKSGDDIELFNDRGKITVKAQVTKRLAPLTINGKKTHTIALPWHWGKTGIATGAVANALSINVGDANTYIPESKAFLVDVRKAG